MPIPVIDYTKNQVQGDPAAAGQLKALFEGMKLGFEPFFLKNKLTNDELLNSLLKVKNQYAPRMAEEDLKEIELKNILAKIKSQYEPDILKAGLNKTLLENIGISIANQYAPSINEAAIEKARGEIDFDKLKSKYYAPEKEQTIRELELKNAGLETTNKYSPFINEANLKKTDLENKVEELKAKYYAQEKEAAINKINLENIGLGIANQYASSEKEANLKKINLENQLDELKAKYYAPEKEATINKINLESKFIPFDMALKAENAKNKNTRFGTAYQFARMLGQLPMAARAKYIADNASEVSDMLNTLGNKTLQDQAEEEEKNNIISKIISEYFPNVSEQNTLPISDKNKQILQNNAPAPFQIDTNFLSNQQPDESNRKFKTTPESVDSLKETILNEANRRLTTAATQRQAEGAQQLELAMNDKDFLRRADNAFKYAGAIGKGKSFVDQLNQKNPDSYIDYDTFRKRDMLLMESRLKALDQIGTTDKQREMLEEMFDVVKSDFASNPERAKKYFNGLVDSINNISRSVIKSAQPVAATNRYGGENKQTYLKGFSNEDVEYTAQQMGLSIEETVERLKEKYRK